MTKFEYQILKLGIDEPAERKLNEAGEFGWELVAIRPVVTTVGSDWKWLAVMKRNKS